MRSLKRDKITHTEFILHEIDKEVDSTLKLLFLQLFWKRINSPSLHGEGRSLFDYLMKKVLLLIGVSLM
jgi:hypothetical protein